MKSSKRISPMPFIWCLNSICKNASVLIKLYAAVDLVLVGIICLITGADVQISPVALVEAAHELTGEVNQLHLGFKVLLAITFQYIFGQVDVQRVLAETCVLVYGHHNAFLSGPHDHCCSDL